MARGDIVKEGALDIDGAVASDTLDQGHVIVSDADLAIKEKGWARLATLVFSSHGVYWEFHGSYGVERTTPVHVSYFLAELESLPSV